MLEYDNSAFYYFAMTLMCMYLLPGTWYTLSEVWKAFFSTGDADGEARCEAEKAKMDKIKAETTGLARLSKRGFLINAACLLATWAVFAYFMYQVMGDSGQVQQYDPYTILGVEHGATASEIKKAYRRLSLKFHPDKNIGNKEAEEMFKKIAKAHEALTDEQSKENYEKYGNPDGRQQSLEVSIGLPKILLENPKVVLVLYLIGMVIVIPAGAYAFGSRLPLSCPSFLSFPLFSHSPPPSLPLPQPWATGTRSPRSSARRTSTTTRTAPGCATSRAPTRR